MSVCKQAMRRRSMARLKKPKAYRARTPKRDVGGGFTGKAKTGQKR